MQVLPLNLQDTLFPLYGITSRVIVKKNKEIMEVNILAFIATALFILVLLPFTYYLCKNSQPK
ncbi:hypothetical protein GQ55_9G345900 [Panicum hallii var. hallii]|uniref:Photosystem II reaction center protein M n=1 Tax=Panicum hallii var. hallii TaxID=1504633 RepID=A0A2T7C8H0_9POAL|nr:hypothetical protein GQ55_9G345900 [Panicum hallii var. hallii]